jgi:pimeloyl-ACP methyl ester carboxylesterase
MAIYKSRQGERAVRERYLKFLERWPVANRQFHVPTRQGETFVVACGNPEGPPVILLHGGAANSAMWMGDIAAWAAEFQNFAGGRDRRTGVERTRAASAEFRRLCALA